MPGAPEGEGGTGWGGERGLRQQTQARRGGGGGIRGRVEGWLLAHPGLIGLGGAFCAINEAQARSPQVSCGTDSGLAFTGKGVPLGSEWGGKAAWRRWG